MPNKKAIITVRFESNLSQEALHKNCQSFLSSISDIKGLLATYHYVHLDSRVVGGTYIFKDIRLAEHYVKTFLMNGIGLRYGILPETLKIETWLMTSEVSTI